MGALNRSDLQCGVRHLTVRFHHSHGAKGERTAKNENRKIPGHRYSLPLPTPHSTNRAGMGVTTVTKHRFYLATPKRELPSKAMRFGSSATDLQRPRHVRFSPYSDQTAQLRKAT